MISLVSSTVSFLAISLIRGYQWTIRPLMGPRCRFVPHCSDYAIESYQKHGPVVGSWLTAKRLGRCHPWCEGGLDPVPEHLDNKDREPRTAVASQPNPLR